MIQLKKILVAFDGSEYGLKALNAAKELAKSCDAQLTVVYVHGEPLEYAVSIGTNPAGEEFMFQQYTASGSVTKTVPPGEQETIVVEEEMPQQIISMAAAKLSDLPGVTYEKLVGKPAEKIVQFATDNDIDVIVIGHRGIGAFKKMFTGSVSEKVTTDAECSVFIVK